MTIALLLVAASTLGNVAPALDRAVTSILLSVEKR